MRPNEAFGKDNTGSAISENVPKAAKASKSERDATVKMYYDFINLMGSSSELNSKAPTQNK